MIADTYRFEAEALALSNHSSTQEGEQQ